MTNKSIERLDDLLEVFILYVAVSYLIIVTSGWQVLVCFGIGGMVFKRLVKTLVVWAASRAVKNDAP